MFNIKSIMKKSLILFFASLFMIAVTGCGEEKKNSKDGTADSTATTEGSGSTNADDPNATADGNQPTPENGIADPSAQISDLPTTTVSWKEMKHDFGKVKEGEVVTHKYEFTNTGDNPAKVENVKPSCGCTTPDWTKEEIAPGQKGYVTVQFDTKAKQGNQTKTVNVVMNTEQRTTMLTFSAEVLK